jgi:hypothetical protein
MLTMPMGFGVGGWHTVLTQKDVGKCERCCARACEFGASSTGDKFDNPDTSPLRQANEVLPIVHHTPVFAGVCASDPFRNIPRFLRQLKDLGIVGVQVGGLP